MKNINDLINDNPSKVVTIDGLQSGNNKKVRTFSGDFLNSKIFEIAHEMLKDENKEFIIRKEQKKIWQFMLLYFIGDIGCESIFPDKNYKLSKNIMLIGDVGVGKTFMMDIFCAFTKQIGLNRFISTSIPEMINHYKVHNNLDKYTYNITGDTFFDPKYKKTLSRPNSICINDLGLTTHLHFGTDTKIFIEDLLLARYEIYQKSIKTHITTNRSVDELCTLFEKRITDRFKSYNVIIMEGESFR